MTRAAVHATSVMIYMQLSQRQTRDLITHNMSMLFSDRTSVDAWLRTQLQPVRDASLIYTIAQK